MDWYPLLDLCGYKGCFDCDGDGIDDPATVNGRLLLGLQGTLSAWERHTMKARLTARLIHKAWPRGERLDAAHRLGPYQPGHGAKDPQPGSPSPPVVGVRDIFTMSFSQ